MKEHVEEIEERYTNNDEHWSIGTADLIVLCYKLSLLENKDIDDVFNRCLPRFDDISGRMLVMFHIHGLVISTTERVLQKGTLRKTESTFQKCSYLTEITPGRFIWDESLDCISTRS